MQIKIKEVKVSVVEALDVSDAMILDAVRCKLFILWRSHLWKQMSTMI